MSGAPPATDAPAEEPAEKPAGKKRIVLVALVTGVLVLGGAGAWLVPKLLPNVFGRAAKPPPAEAAVKSTVALGPVVVNLNGETRRYLRIGVSLGLTEKEGKAIEQQQAQLLDLLISVFAATDVEVLSSDAGKAKLKTELLKRMREELRLEQVSRVYFTEFVIQ